MQLCPNSVLQLSGPIFFTAKDQELSTEGYPTDDSRAKLVCTGDAITAVQYVHRNDSLPDEFKSAWPWLTFVMVPVAAGVTAVGVLGSRC